MEKINLNWLRNARREKHLTLKSVAELIGKDRSTMWRYEAGEIPITVDVFFQLLQIYGISITDVIMCTEGNASYDL